MKQIIVLVGFIFLMSCNTSMDKSPASAESGLPEGAIEQPFEDNPGMSVVTTNDSQGNLSAYGIYVNGVREGSWVEYHPNGHVKAIYGYVKGQKEGQAVELDDRGQLLERFTYHNDVLNGPYTKYNRSQIKEERNYKDGKLDGQTKIYYDNRKIMEESMYKNGIRDGIGRWYDQEGNLMFEYTYKDGELIKDKE
ncbi:MAG: toxin-antitoxin system YwqK family antitoxin [Cyclobacteriaceae bacterium]|nr:toxin-antitoxin system YwqK family antitoxin [Cyclobacteriaceae bacterium]